MKTVYLLWCATLFLALALVGCKDASPDRGKASAPGQGNVPENPPSAPAEEAKIQANLDKLSAEDRKLAAEQKFCAIEEENRLGTMGVPVKVMVKDQAVFLCCKGCRKEALADPEKILARVKELRKRVAASPAK